MARSSLRSLALAVVGVLSLSPLTTVAASGAPADGGSDRYIVVLRGPSVADRLTGAYTAGSPAAERAEGAVLAQQATVLAAVDADPGYQYTTALNGFAAELTDEQVAQLRARADVASVERAGMRTLPTPPPRPEPAASPSGPAPATYSTPDLLDVRGPGGAWEQLGGASKAGRGVVVGLIDTGISPRSPSFRADGMPAAPSDWAGTCEKGQDPARWSSAACSTKLIGARYHTWGRRASGLPLAPGSSESPFDTVGHGTHTASTAAGRATQVATPDVGTKTVSGMAPMAYVAMYKACWVVMSDGRETPACFDEDIINAVDLAVRDGVDVLNFSIGGGWDGDYGTYGYDQAFLGAAKAGVFIAAAAGNDAPQEHVSNGTPWLTTVAAADAFTSPESPSVAYFSQRGPVDVAPGDQNLLKPDVTAPGIMVYAAINDTEYAYLDGTSMASPHIAGIGALVRQKHPGWSPMAIRSALQTTTTRLHGIESQSPFDGGSGLVNARNVLRPGLVFDSGPTDWAAFMADHSTGYRLNTASVVIGALPSSGPRTVTRTIRNVGTTTATYSASVRTPAHLEVTTASSVTLAPGESRQVSIRIRNLGAPADAWQHGEITWTAPGRPAVAIPIAARGPVTTPTTPVAQRWSGPTRYATAEKIASAFPTTSDTVYVASGRSHADALAGSPAAARGLVPGLRSSSPDRPASVVLVNGTSVPWETKRALWAASPANIVILGGEAAVPAEVERWLRDNTGWPRVVRVAGATRYATAAKISSSYPAGTPVVYIASGENTAVADAVSAAAVAGRDRAPLLLTRADAVPQETRDALARLNPQRIVVVGGTKAVSAQTYAALGATSRLSGATRYETSVAVARTYAANPSAAYLASGATWPDALTGAALAGYEKNPVLLSKPDAVPSTVMSALDRLSPQKARVLGGTNALSPAVVTQLNARLPIWATS